MTKYVSGDVQAVGFLKEVSWNGTVTNRVLFVSGLSELFGRVLAWSVRIPFFLDQVVALVGDVKELRESFRFAMEDNLAQEPVVSPRRLIPKDVFQSEGFVLLAQQLRTPRASILTEQILSSWHAHNQTWAHEMYVYDPSFWKSFDHFHLLTWGIKGEVSIFAYAYIQGSEMREEIISILYPSIGSFEVEPVKEVSCYCE